MTDSETSVKVGLRIRPQLAREKIDACRVCTSVIPGEPQVVLGNDKAFTFDHVFDMGCNQEAVYRSVAYDLIEGCLEGYNATILAYGQTGSGKTYSMGTGFDASSAPSHSGPSDYHVGEDVREDVGIIPRGVTQLFEGIRRREEEARAQEGAEPPSFQVFAQFMELYNEEIYDLLRVGGTTAPPGGGSEDKRPASAGAPKSNIKIHEDSQGGIYTMGVTSRQVKSPAETMECLKVGALSRTTASTSMNSQSSRSHAVFTLRVKQTRLIRPQVDEDGKEEDTSVREYESLQAKFHFVDLAGSERLKRTMATGDRAKEGIAINCGLLALGNVISALGDKAKKGSHVPYRDSKLTRLLQDSLGGNSRTVMIACISPSDRDFMETLNTLKYANRARNIKNRVTLNQDKTSKQLSELRGEIQKLQVELLEYKQGKRTVGPDGVECINDMFHENSLLQAEADKLRQRVKALQETVNSLTSRNTALQQDKAAILASAVTGDSTGEELQKMVTGYVAEIEGLRSQLFESEALCEQLRRVAGTARHAVSTMANRVSLASSALSPHPFSDGSGSSPFFTDSDGRALASPDTDVPSLIKQAKRDVKNLKKQVPAADKDAGADVNGNTGDTSSAAAEEEGQQDEGHVSEEREDSQEKSSEDNDEDGDQPTGVTTSGGDEGSASEVVAFEEDEIEEDIDETTDSESDKEEEHLHADLADLTTEITIKQRLIEELEKSQRQLHAIRKQYEDKLSTLHDKIRATETERDDILKNLSDRKSESNEAASKVRQDYEKRLNDMQTELKKLNSAKREHSKLLRNQAHYDKQLRALQGELIEMKKVKVKLMTQISAESARSKESEKKRLREVSKLRKENQQKLVEIKNLEIKSRQKDVILRRKLEEMDSLRRKQNMRQAARKPPASATTKKPSTNAAGASPSTSTNSTPTVSRKPPSSPAPPTSGGRKGTPNRVSPAAGPSKRSTPRFSPKLAKGKWDGMEHFVSSVVVRRQTVAAMEREMDVHIRRREELSKRIDHYTRDLDRARHHGEDTLAVDLEDQLESIGSNMVYVQNNIDECQNSIMQMEEEAAREEAGTPSSSLVQSLSLEEARYCLEHFINYSVNKGFELTQKEAAVRETETKLRKSQMDARLREQLLSHYLDDHCEEEGDLYWTGVLEEGAGSGGSGRGSPTAPAHHSSAYNPMFASVSAAGDGCAFTDAARQDASSPTSRRVDKARCRTSTTTDLLFVGSTHAADSPRDSPPMDGPIGPDDGYGTLLPASASLTDPFDSCGSAMVQQQQQQQQRPPLPNLADMLPPAPRMGPYIESITEESEPEEEEVELVDRRSVCSTSTTLGTVDSESTPRGSTSSIGSAPGHAPSLGIGIVKAQAAAIANSIASSSSLAAASTSGSSGRRGSDPFLGAGKRPSGVSSLVQSKVEAIESALQRSGSNGSLNERHDSSSGRGSPPPDGRQKLGVTAGGRQRSCSSPGLPPSSPPPQSMLRQGSYTILPAASSCSSMSSSTCSSGEESSPLGSPHSGSKVKGRCYTLEHGTVSEAHSASDIPAATAAVDSSPSGVTPEGSTGKSAGPEVPPKPGRSGASRTVSNGSGLSGIRTTLSSGEVSGMGKWRGVQVNHLDVIDGDAKKSASDVKVSAKSADDLSNHSPPSSVLGSAQSGIRSNSPSLEEKQLTKVEGRRKLALGTASPTLRRKQFNLPSAPSPAISVSSSSGSNTSVSAVPGSNGVSEQSQQPSATSPFSLGVAPSRSRERLMEGENKTPPSSPLPPRRTTVAVTLTTTPSSPSPFRRVVKGGVATITGVTGADGEENVFARLSGRRRPSQHGDSRKRGEVVSRNPPPGSHLAAGKREETSCLTWTHTAKGHTRAVLDVFSHENLLFTASKDCTCKVWDMSVGAETQSLGGHPNNVTKVLYSPLSRLAFTSSMSYVKVWDTRSKSTCIKVLSSTGLVHDDIPTEVSGRQAPQQGENIIFDICLSPCGKFLYTTAGNSIRIWDLSQFNSVGKVVTGHQAPVTVMCTGATSRPSVKGSNSQSQLLVSGSKDHYVKVTEIGKGSPGTPLLQPSYTLEPPHYDGIQALALTGVGAGGPRTLFTGSRDRCLKMWNLEEQSLVQSMNNAHNNWITDLVCVGDNSKSPETVVLSSCRSGYIKLWRANASPGSSSFTFLDEVLAHSSGVNALSVCSRQRNLYTASNNGYVGVWKLDTSEL